jgi:hypothetical protein
MRLEFDLDSVKVTEFGVGLEDGNGQTFVMVPVDADVQAALREMVWATWKAMQTDEEGAAKYEPSEKHGATEYLILPLDDDLATSVRELQNAVNLDVDTAALEDPAEIFCYFARLLDKKKRRLTALRRATQFKGVLKKRLIRLVSDSVQLIDDHVFKLDTDFDFLADSANVHILRPSGFEFAGRLQQAILDAVPDNIKAISRQLDFVEFEGIEEYARRHPRAARYLASILGQKETRSIDKALLKKLCKQTGVEVGEEKGKIKVPAGHEMDFLEVLDRRRYEVNLVREQPERYRAASRRKIES